MIEQVLESSTVPLAAQLNAACQCIWVDRAKLHDQLRANLGDAASLRAGLVVVPLAGLAVAALARPAFGRLPAW